MFVRKANTVKTARNFYTHYMQRNVLRNKVCIVL